MMTVHTIDAIGAIDAVRGMRAVCAIDQWCRFQPLPVELAVTGSQTLSSLLGCDVTLRLCHHLIADLELADTGASQKWWVEVNMEMARLDLVSCTLERRLVHTHAWWCC